MSIKQRLFAVENKNFKLNYHIYLDILNPPEAASAFLITIGSSMWDLLSSSHNVGGSADLN